MTDQAIYGASVALFLAAIAIAKGHELAASRDVRRLLSGLFVAAIFGAATFLAVWFANVTR